MPPSNASGARVLALHWQDVCERWRLKTPFDALSAYGYTSQFARMDRIADVPDVDLLVMHCPSGEGPLRVIESARERGVRVVVDVDDLFRADILRTSWFPVQNDSGEFHRNASRWRFLDPFESFCLCVKAADALTVSTATLAKEYACINPRVHVLPNCYDDENPLWHLTTPNRTTVNIGFAGMGTHGANVALLKKALETVLRAHPRACVVEAGAPLGPELLPLLDLPPERLIYLGTAGVQTYPILLHHMDIVLAPLVDEAFTRCKSNIRCMTAGVVGAPVIASPVGAYADYVQHGVNGFHARNQDEWTDYLERLVGDAPLRRRMGAANREAAQAFAISANVCRWHEVYDGLLGGDCRA